jgi:3-methyladenine DNA glycosylase AlkD
MDDILNEIVNNKDESYRIFSIKSIPNINSNKIIGVRIPILRNISKKYYSYRKKFMNNLPHKYQEENLIHSFFISQNTNLDEVLTELDTFLPYIDNWAVSDTISPKVFKKDLNKVYKYIKKWIKSKYVYEKRFAICSLLQFYLDSDFDLKYNNLVLSVKSNEYYINMAIAWYFSFALIKQYDKTISIFENKLLDKWVHNKSIQKAIESYRISDEKKKYLKSLKII